MSASAWLEKWLPGFTTRDRKTNLRAVSPFLTTYEMEAVLSETGKFKLVASGFVEPPGEGAGVEVKGGGKTFRLPFEIFEFRYQSRGYSPKRYELSVTVDGLEGVKDISEVELRFLPLL